METARKAIIGREVLPVCVIFPIINSRTFESEDERRKHTGAEFYNTYMGEDYEKEMMAAVERVISSKYDPRHFEEMKDIKRSYKDKVNRLYTACRYCRGCYNECVKDLARMGELLDIIGSHWTLLYDQRIEYFQKDHDMSGHPDIYTSPDFYDWSKHIPSEYELMLDKWENERETEGKAECLCGMCLSDDSECDEMSLD